MNPIQLVLISGMGGAGRTTALHTLEDLGFYCVDNLPIVLLPSFLAMLRQHDAITRVAIGIDIRDTLFLPETPKVIDQLCAQGYAPEVVFLDASDAVLCYRLARMAVHAAMAGRTNCVVGRLNDDYSLVPIPLATIERRKVELTSNLWASVLDATGQEFYMNPEKNARGAIYTP